MASIKILSYNIHKGLSFNNKFILKEMKQAIQLVNADVVLLQEVEGENKDKDLKHHKGISTPQFEFLADSIWHHYAYGKNAIKEHRHHGNALLSKYPIIQWDNTDVSSSNFEKRGILYTKMDIPSFNHKLHIFCLHLSLLHRDRLKQIATLKKIIKEKTQEGDPVIIAGDFNDWNQKINSIMDTKLGMKEAFVELTQDNPRTFPSSFPLLKLDRVYFKNMEALSALALSGKPWTTLSDHLALLVEFKLKA